MPRPFYNLYSNGSLVFSLRPVVSLVEKNTIFDQLPIDFPHPNSSFSPNPTSKLLQSYHFQDVLELGFLVLAS
ncbi:hypothetical protein L1887_40077 [Cichorium endivia]|nr:hypothetical protein L1887_40077 [Cichorium endivia]